jgi:hypothetical protein
MREPAREEQAEQQLVIIQPQDFRLPEVLRHIEAGKIVVVILTPDPKAKPKQDRP